MLKLEKVYRNTLYVFFIIHVILFVFITVACFFPFIDGENYFSTYKGILAERLTRVQPVGILLLPLLSCVFSFLVIRRNTYGPLSYLQSGVYHLGTLIGDICFSFIIMIKPITMLAAGSLTSVIIPSPFDSSEIEGHIFGTGFYMVSYASYIVYFDIALILFAIALSIAKKIRYR